MSKLQVMIVEDEKVVARDIQKSVEKLGYSVCALVSSGEEAVQKSEELRPDLILMDIVLKREMNGITAAKQIRKLFDIPVVYLTACDDEMILQQTKITGSYGYIIKPFEDRELHAAIEIALYRNQAESRINLMEHRLAGILRNINAMVIDTDGEGGVTFMNEAAEDLTGWKKEKALGKKLTEVLEIKDDNLSDVDKIWLSKLMRRRLNIPCPA